MSNETMELCVLRRISDRFVSCSICGKVFDLRSEKVWYFDDDHPGQFAHDDCVNKGSPLFRVRRLIFTLSGTALVEILYLIFSK